jgi:hypothetical protein
LAKLPNYSQSGLRVAAPIQNARNSTVSLGRDVLISAGKGVADELVSTNAANFTGQINKITILVSNLPNFADGSKQNPERNRQVELDLFFLDGTTQKLNLNGSQRLK